MTGPTVRVRVERASSPAQTPLASTRRMSSLQSSPSNPNSKSNPPTPLFSLSRIDADVSWAGGRGGGGFMSNSLSTSLSLPLARYMTRLIAGEHHSLLWDCMQPRSEEYDDRDMSDGGRVGGYSKPIVVLDVIWNLAFVSVSMVVLLSTFQERSSRV